METVAAPSARRQIRLQIATAEPMQFIDLTDRVKQLVAESEVDNGIVNIQSLHTTVAIVLNEHEPLLLGDFAALLERTAPLGISYYHDNLDLRTVNLTPNERFNGHAHCRAILLAPSAALNIIGGRLQLGQWQRILLVELDGPRNRDISIVMLADSGR
jgi:secondary thiamine-phosphate synthase enzyme